MVLLHFTYADGCTWKEVLALVFVPYSYRPKVPCVFTSLPTPGARAQQSPEVLWAARQSLRAGWTLVSIIIFLHWGKNCHYFPSFPPEGEQNKCSLQCFIIPRALACASAIYTIDSAFLAVAVIPQPLLQRVGVLWGISGQECQISEISFFCWTVSWFSKPSEHIFFFFLPFCPIVA